MSAWLRAVALPAWRRAAAVWAALAILASLVMGPTGLLPADVVALLEHSRAIAAVLGALWLALLHPVARTLVRGEEALYLRSLAAPRGHGALPALALAVMHAPPPLLFLATARPVQGGSVWLALTASSYALALARLPARPARRRWRTAGQALRAVLASRLLVDDALLRGFAFAGLAGCGGGLMIRNNQLLGAAAATLGLGTVMVLGAPAWAAITQPLARNHHRLAPLCLTAGMSSASWLAQLAAVLGGTLAALHALAAALAALLAGLGALDALRLIGGAAVIGGAAGVGAVRVAAWATRSAQVPQRILLGTLLVAALGALLLGVFGELALLAAPALAAAAVARTPEPSWA